MVPAQTVAERTARTEVFHVRLSKAEQEALRAVAERRDLHIGQVVRALIREASGKYEA